MRFLRRYLKEVFIAIVIAFIAGAIIDLVHTRYKEKKVKKVLHQNQNAVARIQTYQKREPYATCSGVFIDNQGTLVTNYHVLRGADLEDTEAKLNTGAFYKFKTIIAADNEEDIAILKFEAQGTPYVKLGNSSHTEAGEKVYAIGSPLGLEDTVSTGVISNPKRRLNEHEFIQFTAPVSLGSSGGGLFDSSGKVIGIVISSLNLSPQLKGEVQNMNLALPSNLIKNVLDGKDKSLSEDSPVYYYSLGVLAENKHDFDKAEQYYKKAVELNNNFAAAYENLGGIYYEKGLYKQEIQNYLKASQIDPNNYEYFYYLATAYEDEGLFDQAINAYQQALKINPEDKDSIHDLAILYLATGKKDKSMELLPKLIKLDRGWGEELKLLLRQYRS